MEDLLTSLRPGVFRFCRFRLSSYGGGPEAADDAAQETCLAVSQVLSGYVDQGAPFGAWVYGIAARKVADTQRRFGRGGVLTDELPDQAEPSGTPEERLVLAVELGAALKLIDRLPTRMREVLVRRASGATAQHVAADLGMSAGAVDVAHHRAQIRLRELVDESEEYRELFDLRTAPPGRRMGRAA